MDRPDDVIRDILDRLHDAFAAKKPIDSAFWQSFEHEIRQHWGGERQYIAKTGEAHIRYMSMRDQAIAREAQRGEHTKFLAVKYRISERRVRQIVCGNALP